MDELPRQTMKLFDTRGPCSLGNALRPRTTCIKIYARTGVYGKTHNGASHTGRARLWLKPP
jgi:hypothetical protein